MSKLTFNKIRKRVLFSKCSLALALASASFGVNAQTTVQIGTSTTTSTDNAPVRTQAAFSYSQSLYMASDMIAGGASVSGTISKVRYYLNSGTNNANSNNLTVYLGNTTKTTFATTTDWVPAAAMTNCFSGVVTYAANSWVEITLTTPFVWNGVDNIVVAVDENATGTGGNAMWRYSDLGGANQRTIFNYGATNPDPASPPTATSRGSWTPNIQFEWTAPACAGTPTHRTATVNDGSICPGQTVNFGTTGGTPATGLSYEWEYTTGSSGWQTYAGATAATFSTIPTQTVNVRVITTCVSTGDRDTSDDVSVVVNGLPQVTVNTPSAAFCAGESVQLIAADTVPTTTFAWLPATGLNVANNDTVNANPANATTYTVTATNVHGCTATATSYVTPLARATRTASFTPNEICEPGSPVVITTTVTPALIAGGSSWEYRFLDANGVELQPWNTSNVFNFVPAADSVYKIYYDVRSNGCLDQVDSLPLTMNVGFGADLSIVNYDCNNLGGTVSITDYFDPSGSVIYSNPFTATANLTGVTLTGNAAVTGGRLVLTPSAAGNTGSAIIPNSGVPLGPNNSFKMKFKLTADQVLNTFGTGGGDGLTYSFANDVANNGNQNGSGTKLRLVFDAADNTTNLAGIYLVYGHTGAMNATSLTPGSAGTVHYINNIAAWKTKTDVDVDFIIDENGKASLSLDGVSIFADIQMPTTYMNENTSTWKHAFSASTGGDALRHAISNLNISTSSCQFALVPEGTTPSTWGEAFVFTGIQPGSYDVWLSSNGNSACSKKVQTVEVINTNPLVELGNDTTICEGETLVLNAGNTGATYVWSNSQVTTQTREVTQTGLYVVNVTAANGCVGVGSINVGVAGAPTASTIYVQNNMPTYTFTILNAQNVNEYSWSFGDGTTLTNAPATVSHTYLTAGPKMVTVTLTNDCGTEEVIQTVVVTSTASLETNEIEGLSIYPNPATDKLNIALPNAMNASAIVYSSTGSVIASITNLDAQTELSVQNWNPGVYFVRVQNDDQTSTIKLVIQ
ncbi:PKD domain protein [compost metagenome]